MAKNSIVRLLMGFIVFGIALTIRLEYQKHIIPDNPLRGDAKLYFVGGYNLVNYGVFSTTIKKIKGEIPKPTSFVPPGYSLFLTPFLQFSETGPEFYRNVITCQAVLGAFISLLAFFLTLTFLGNTEAFFVGILTALSPHMISIETNLLSETLFAFLLLAAIMVQIFAVKKQNNGGAVLSGILLGFAAITRPIIILLPFLLWTTFLCPDKTGKKEGGRKKLILFFVCGFFLVKGGYEVRNFLSVKKTGGTVSRVWTNFLLGTYPNFTHIDFYGYPHMDDPLYEKMSNNFEFGRKEILRRFIEEPGKYILWYFGGKQIGMWQWDLTPGGDDDVYVYPVKASAFSDGGILQWLKDFMKYLHPMVLLTGAGGFFIAIYRILKKIDWMWFPIVMLLIYHTVLLTLLFPIPRLTIPLRPYLYLLSVFCISKMVHLFVE